MSTDGSNSVRDAVSTHIRHEYFLGPVHVLVLSEKTTGHRVTQVCYELNVIDGWVRVCEWTDDLGLIWEGRSTAPCRIRTVVEAAPHHAEFIATAHLLWVTALADAGHARRASSQRRALTRALHRHGLDIVPSDDDPSTLAAQYAAVADLRGSMDDGYDDQRVNRVLGRIAEVFGLRMLCVWDYYDDAGVGGNSDFYVDVGGRLHHCAGDLWRWLNGSPEDPGTPSVPGPPASWVGEPADFGEDQLAYDDGHLNYAVRDDLDHAAATQ